MTIKDSSTSPVKKPKTALVIEGIHGIGAAICRALKADGFQVIAHHWQDWTQARAFASAEDIPIMEWSMSSWEACQTGLSDIARHWSMPSVLVNHVRSLTPTSWDSITPQQWSNDVTSPLTGAMALMQGVVPSMCQKGYGRLITVGRFHGLSDSTETVIGHTLNASLLGLTKTMAKDIAPYGVTANMVATGHVRTQEIDGIDPDMLEHCVKNIPLQRLGTPEEIANLVVFLCSSHAAFMTGSTLHVNGGQWMA